MRLSEIAEYVVKNNPDCCMAVNKAVIHGHRDDWYEESLIDELMNYFSYEVIDMCGCGNPESTYESIRRLLNIRNDWRVNKIKYEEVIERYEKELHVNRDDDIQWGLLQFMLYQLDSCGILEHGSSIGGSWLTKEGEMYLTVLNAWHEQE